jgi:putative addiction module killer protein
MDEELIRIELYEDLRGKYPFEEWFKGLKDRKAKAMITNRLNRVSLGNFGDFKSVGQGVYELRIQFGPGYRIYFGKENSRLVILLAGGDKSNQMKDIEKAKRYWADYSGEEP